MPAGRAVVLAAVAWIAPGCDAPPAEAPPAAAEAAFVGRATCEGCHRQEAAAWRGSHHDLAMQPATDDTVLGDFADATFSYGDVTSRFFRRDRGFWVRTDDAAGDLREFRIEYVFGVDPLQQYLVPFPDGRYQVLSLCWDTRPAAAGGQRWFHIYADQAVGHDDPLHWTGPYQNWNYMCAECHSTRLDKGYAFEADRYATTWQEIDVSCEACHGPGSRHVEQARRAAEGDASATARSGLAVALRDADGGSWRIAPGEPTARRSVPRTDRAEVETCGRCHSRRAQIHGDYRHGAPLADTHRVALLDADLYHADGQILDEVYEYGSFLQSRMAHEGVRCSDCHEPHSIRLREEGNALCATCHAGAVFDTPAHHHHEQGTAGSACVDCHMPSRVYMVVDPRRDHGFRVPRPDLSARIGTPNACTDCHESRDAAWAERTVRAWFPAGRSGAPHWAEALHAGRTLQADAPGRLAATVADPVLPAIVRATALQLLERWLGPRHAPLLDRALGDPDPFVRVAAVAALERFAPEPRLTLGARALDDPVRIVRMEAGRVLAGVPPDRLPQALRPSLERAIDEYSKAQWFNADRAESHLNLGVLWMQRGDAAQAEQAFERSLAVLPSVPAYVDLADLRRLQGREAEAERLLRQAIALAPDAGAPQHALGLALVRGGRRDAGLAALGRATELEPDDPRFAYVYGVGLWDAGRREEALAVLGRAQARFPGDRDLLVALSTFERDAGRLDAALGWARALVALDPGDPAPQALVAELQAAAGPG